VSEDPLEWLARAILPPDEPLFLPVPGDEPATAWDKPAGYLTQEIIDQALSAAAKPMYSLPPGGYRGGRVPFGMLPVTTRPPDWTVEADGYRLIIQNGAMIGLEYGSD
jgi:hypothetical protein